MPHIVFDPHLRELLSWLLCQPRAFSQYVRQSCKLFHHKDYQLQSPSRLKVCFSHEDKSTQGLSLGFKSLIHWAILYTKYSHVVILLKLPSKNILKRQNECFNLNYFLEKNKSNLSVLRRSIQMFYFTHNDFKSNNSAECWTRFTFCKARSKSENAFIPLPFPFLCFLITALCICLAMHQCSQKQIL